MQARALAGLAEAEFDRSPAALGEIARQVRRSVIAMIDKAGMGHVGGDLSVTDILTVLYFGVLRVDPSVPDWPDRDRFILSKGHCVGALYSVLAQRGFFDEALLADFLAPLSPLNGHPNRRKVPGVEANTGPLGHGLPIAVGSAPGGPSSSSATASCRKAATGRRRCAPAIAAWRA